MSVHTYVSSLTARLARTVCGAALGLGLAVSAVPGLALAQDHAGHTAAAETPAAPALWVVRDADSTLYLFGTVHLLRPGGDWMTPQVADAFQASEALWLEIEDPSDQAAATPLIMQHGLSPQTPLSSRLNVEEQASFDQAAAAMGATRQMLDPMRPWLAAITLSVAPLTQAGYDPAAGVDIVLRQQALDTGKPIHGLETIEQQLMFFADMEPEVELDFLRSTLENFDESAALLDAMAGAWAAGDPDTLYALSGEEMKVEFPTIYDLILTRRNADWVGQIQEELAGSGTVFIAVGALHLAGPDSVQAQLQAAGVSVERVQ
ncbi:MAG: TraB/GumN family protein [Caulobacterales bacterium]|nr:TraB/GumN family protein [Caulobacterales bacterium]